MITHTCHSSTGRWRQKDQAFKVILHCIVSVRWTWGPRLSEGLVSNATAECRPKKGNERFLGTEFPAFSACSSLGSGWGSMKDLNVYPNMSSSHLTQGGQLVVVLPATSLETQFCPGPEGCQS